MEKEKIIEVLSKWNFWKLEIDTGILREEYTNILLDFVETDKIISIVGVRRAGKSTIIKQLAKELIKKINKENILIVNFEEPEFDDTNLKFLQKIYDSYLEIIHPDKPFIFLDEIQNVLKWEKFARAINERKEAFIVISGSSSKLLSEELATILAGRQLYFEVFPLSFYEFLNFNGIEITCTKDILLNSTKIKSLFRNYLEFGGYPEIVLNKNKEFKIRTLRSYYTDILTKDVITRFKIREIEKLKALVKFYLTNISSLITFNSVSRFLDLSVETVRRFTSYIETSKSVFFIKRFSFSIKEQEKAARKVYVIDVGLSNALGFRFSENIGRLSENLVAIQLKRKQALNPMIEIYYFKDSSSREVDFVLKENLIVKQLIQVCWDISSYKTKEREVNALLKASSELECNNLLIITENYDEVEKVNGKKIKFIPLWKWLLIL